MFEERKEFHIDVSANNVSAVELLAKETGFSKQKIKKAMQKGAVWLTDNKGTHRLRRQSKKLSAGSALHFYFDPAVLDNDVVDAILIADEIDYSVWYKPRGMLSQGSKWGDHTAITRWVEQHLKPQRPAFTVHRLDRFASGLILIAHKKKMAAELSALFQNKKISKQYKVIVQGQFPNKTITFNSAIDNKPAISHAYVLQYDNEKNISLLNVDIETGRKHQIRLHLSNAGFPVIGDRLYGEKNAIIDLQLTAFKLSFVSPIDGKVKTYVLAEEHHPSWGNFSLNKVKNMG